MPLPPNPPSAPKWLREMLEALGIKSCGDNSCMFGSPGGMATNGGCRCITRLEEDVPGTLARRLSSEQRLYIRRLVHVLRCVAAKVPTP